MVCLNSFWRLLEAEPDRTTLMLLWQQALENALPAVRHYLHPIDEYARYYPNPNYPSGIWLMVVHYPDGTVGAISEDREVRIELELDDIVCHRLHLGMFRDMLAKTMGIVPATDQPGKRDRVIRLGHYPLAPGEEYPVYAVLDGATNDFHQDVMQLLLKNTTPFILVSGTRTAWHDATLEILKERQIPLVPLCEALEFRDDQFVTTEVWHGAVEALRQVLHPENMVAVSPYEFRKKGDMWVIRFDEEDMYLKDSVGLQCIGQLLTKPDDPVFVMELRAVLNGQKPDLIPQPHAREDAVDQVTLSNLKHRYLELQSELEEAQRDGNEIMEEETEREMENIIQYLGQVKAVGGTTRKVNDEIEKARSATSKAFWRSVNQIRNELPKLAEHLEKSCVVGMVCNYTPEQRFDWVL